MAKGRVKFGTFSGVFTPTILTIIGVILYLRLGWVVGNVGLGAALIIIVLAHITTITTGLSMASMATNTRIGAGGFYAMISRTLGPEMGGAIGIPLYISQTLGATLYIMGFAEVFISIYPEYDFKAVLYASLVCILILSIIGADYAMKVQYIIMALIAGSLVSFMAGPQSFSQPVRFEFHRVSEFWQVFAVFFPAVTGIGAGAAMSGDLKDTRKSIPLGVVSAILVGFVIYISVAVWYAGAGEQGELTQNYLIMVDKSRWKLAVYGGIMGATLSSALGTIVGAPRILYALAKDGVAPFSRVLAKANKKGDPLSAIVFTGVLIFISMQLGDLNRVASILTMFFLVSYGVINFIVFIQLLIKMPSFRPRFSVPVLVPLTGFLWCTAVMFLINPLFASLAIFGIVIVYGLYTKLELKTSFGDLRSGMFSALGQWAIKVSMQFPDYKKSWRPNLLIPVEDPDVWKERIDFVRNVIYPSGSLRLVSVHREKSAAQSALYKFITQILKGKKENTIKIKEEITRKLAELTDDIRKENVFVASTVVDAHSFIEGIHVVIQTIKGMFFPPNTIFFTMSENRSRDGLLREVLAISLKEQLGIIVLASHRIKKFGKKKTLNIWLRATSPNVNLSLLSAAQLEQNWDCTLRLISVDMDETRNQTIRKRLNTIRENARLSPQTEIMIINDSFDNAMRQAPPADINLMGLSQNLNTEWMHWVFEQMDTTCLFILDSGLESVYE